MYRIRRCGAATRRLIAMMLSAAPGFPFALVNAIEGETHNGVAAFAYKDGKITHLRVQIVQQTAPFYVEDYFTASAQVAARWLPANAHDTGRLRSIYELEVKERLTIAATVSLET